MIMYFLQGSSFIIQWNYCKYYSILLTIFYIFFISLIVMEIFLFDTRNNALTSIFILHKLSYTYFNILINKYIKMI